MGSATFMGAKVASALGWVSDGYHYEARIGGLSGVTFTLEYLPSCYRRGQWRLLVVVDHGPDHERWGCFDDADQPMRYYHKLESAVAEADAIAEVLLADFAKRKPKGNGRGQEQSEVGPD